MGREALRAYIKGRQAAATSATSQKIMPLQQKPLQINAETSATSATSKNTDSREIFQTRPFGEAVNDPASSELDTLENLRKPQTAPALNDPASSEQKNLKKPAMAPAVNDLASSVLPGLVQPPAPDPDRWCWPHSEAMTGREIDAFTKRASLFNRRGMPSVNAEALAYKLVSRDRDGDDRRLCLECVHLSGQHGAWRCGEWQRAGMGAPGVPAGLVLVLQRCDGFRSAGR